MAESKLKKIKRFESTIYKTRRKLIELSVKLEMTPFLTVDQRRQIKGQINKLQDKILTYNRKIKALELQQKTN